MVTNLNYFFDKLANRFSSQDSLAVLLSGGIDSTVALYVAKHHCKDIIAIEFNHDDRPNIETQRTKNLIDITNIELVTVNYPIINENNTLRTFKESNALYYLVASDIAIRKNINAVISGQIKDDYTDFDVSDATPNYYTLLNKLIKQEFGVKAPPILTPFLDLTKTEVILLGLKYDVPFELTYSCSEILKTEPCLECYQCNTREKSIIEAKKIYEAYLDDISISTN